MLWTTQKIWKLLMYKNYVLKCPREINNNIAQIVTDTDEVVAQPVVKLCGAR